MKARSAEMSASREERRDVVLLGEDEEAAVEPDSRLEDRLASKVRQATSLLWNHALLCLLAPRSAKIASGKSVMCNEHSMRAKMSSGSAMTSITRRAVLCWAHALLQGLGLDGLDERPTVTVTVTKIAAATPGPPPIRYNLKATGAPLGACIQAPPRLRYCCDVA